MQKTIRLRIWFRFPTVPVLSRRTFWALASLCFCFGSDFGIRAAFAQDSINENRHESLVNHELNVPDLRSAFSDSFPRTDLGKKAFEEDSRIALMTFATEGTLAESRTKFWQHHQDGQSTESMRRDYAKALAAKDMYYRLRSGAVPHANLHQVLGLLQGLSKHTMENKLEDIDDGIHPFVIDDFNRWVKCDVGGEWPGYRSDQERSDASQAAYRKYAVRRDLAEFLFFNPKSPLLSDDIKIFLAGLGLATGQFDDSDSAMRTADVIVSLPAQEEVKELIGKWQAKMRTIDLAKSLPKGTWDELHSQLVLTSDKAFLLSKIQVVEEWSWHLAEARFSQELTPEEREQALAQYKIQRQSALDLQKKEKLESISKKDPRYLARSEAKQRAEDRKTLDMFWKQAKGGGSTASRDVADAWEIHDATNSDYEGMFVQWNLYVETGRVEALRKAVSHREAVIRAAEELIRINPFGQSRQALLRSLNRDLTYIPDALAFEDIAETRSAPEKKSTAEVSSESNTSKEKQIPASEPRSSNRFIEENDKDGDGRLSRAEIARLPRIPDDVFERFDKNRDGFINGVEFSIQSRRDASSRPSGRGNSSREGGRP